MPVSILVIEHNTIARAHLVDALIQDCGFTVCAVDSVGPAQALMSERAEAFDLMILDPGLQNEDGCMFCASLRQQDIHLPIIMISDHGHEDDVVRGFEAGADDYLARPLLIPELLARVRAQLRQLTPKIAVRPPHERMPVGLMLLSAAGNRAGS